MVTHRYCQGIQEFKALDDNVYDCIWIQWVIGHITDEDLKVFFDEKCSKILAPHGFIMIKDNVTTDRASILDAEDSSFTRTYDAYLELFNGLKHFKLERAIKQKNLPKSFLPVRMFILVPK